MNDATRQRLSVPPEVAGQRQSQDHPESCGSTQPAAVPAYQPMTDEEIATAWDRAVFGRDSLRDAISFARAIESAVLARVAAAPAAVQPVAQQQPSVHSGVGVGLPLDTVRTGEEVEREAFEAWARMQFLSPLASSLAWLGWQGRASLGAVSVPAETASGATGSMNKNPAGITGGSSNE